MAATWRGNLYSYAPFEVEPGRVTRLALPEGAPQIPVLIRWEGRDSELHPQLWIVDARGGYSDTVSDADLGVWSGSLGPGRAQVVILPMMGPRRVVSFEVPAVLKDGEEFFEVVVPVGG